MTVEVLKDKPASTATEYPAKFQALLDRMGNNGERRAEVDGFLWRAYEVAQTVHKDQDRLSGDPYFEHCYQVALLLAEWRMDPITIAAGLLHDAIEDTACTKESITEQFGSEVYQLVEGVTKLSGIKFRSREEQQAENYMKMLLSVAKDIRVILIKFADRMHNMRTIEFLPQIKQRRIALETRDVYAPLAHRLGMGRVKWELEDLALKVLEPEVFLDLEKKVRESRSEMEEGRPS